MIGPYLHRFRSNAWCVQGLKPEAHSVPWIVLEAPYSFHASGGSMHEELH